MLLRTKYTINELQEENTAQGDDFVSLKLEITDLHKQLMEMKEEHEKDRRKKEQDITSLKRRLDNETALVQKCQGEVSALGLQVAKLMERWGEQQSFPSYKVDNVSLVTGECNAMIRMAAQQHQNLNAMQLRSNRIRTERGIIYDRTYSPKARIPVLAKVREATAQNEKKKKKRQPRKTRDTTPPNEIVYTLDCILDRRLKSYFYVRWSVDNSESWVTRNDILDKKLLRDFENSYRGLDESIEIIGRMENVDGKRQYRVHWKNGNPKWSDLVNEDDLSPDCLRRINI